MYWDGTGSKEEFCPVPNLFGTAISRPEIPRDGTGHETKTPSRPFFGTGHGDGGVSILSRPMNTPNFCCQIEEVVCGGAI